jgi:hypothetical protein
LNRKLILLDVALAAGAIYGGLHLHSQREAAKALQAEIVRNSVKPAPPPVVAPLAREPVVLPSGYKDIAVKTLFDPSRNPDVPVEPPPPPPKPPEPPPLPDFYGSMDLGDGPFAVMSAAGETRQQEVHTGGMIGPFKLLSFSRQEIALEWDGRVIHKHVEEHASRGGKAPGPIGLGGGAGVAAVIPGQASAPQPEARGTELGPGEQMTDTFKACQAGDSSPAGAVVDGYRKEVMRTALGGTQCHWTAVGK